MPLLRINATPQGLALNDMLHPDWHCLPDKDTKRGPAIIMLHGYKYDPSSKTHCPHQKIFRNGPGGWPEALGYGSSDPREGLGIAFGWFARGPLARVHRRARTLGESLSVIISVLRMQVPDRPVHVIAHSMGSEAALSALEYLPAGAVDRMILLTGASFAGRATRMLNTPAGRCAEVFNITSRENDLFDMAFENLVPCDGGRDHAIGRGIDAANVVTLQLDCPLTLEALASMNLAIAPPERRICHWSGYTRPGVMALYTHLLRDPSGMTPKQLRAKLPKTPAPRWSRFPDAADLLSCLFHRPVTRPGPPLALRLKNRIMAGTHTREKNNEHAC